MPDINIFGVRINYDDVGTGQPLLFIHGWCGNRQSFEKQIEYFKDTHRCLSIDLPGHGKSAKPMIDLSVVFFAEVLVGFIHKLKLSNPTLVGHSLGGLIALEMLHQDEACAHSVALIDPGLILHSGGVKASMEKSLARMLAGDWRQYFRENLSKFMTLPTDPKELLPEILGWSEAVPTQAALSSWRGMLDWEGKAALKAASGKPLCYLAARHPNNERLDILRYSPSVMWAIPLLGSHHMHLAVPGQVNCMLDTFFRL